MAASLVIASCRQSRDPARQSQAIASLFKNRWTTYQGDERFARLTVDEFAHFTKCEAVYLGLVDSGKIMTVQIQPQEATSWAIGGAERKAGSFEVRVTISGHEATAALKWTGAN